MGQGCCTEFENGKLQEANVRPQFQPAYGGPQFQPAYGGPVVQDTLLYQGPPAGCAATQDAFCKAPAALQVAGLGGQETLLYQGPPAGRAATQDVPTIAVVPAPVTPVAAVVPAPVAAEVASQGKQDDKLDDDQIVQQLDPALEGLVVESLILHAKPSRQVSPGVTPRTLAAFATGGSAVPSRMR